MLLLGDQIDMRDPDGDAAATKMLEVAGSFHAPERIGMVLGNHDGHRCHLFRAAELQRLLADHGLEVLDMAASNCLSTGWELTATRQDPERWAELLHLELEATREAGCLDMGSHLIAVVRTPSLG